MFLARLASSRRLLSSSCTSPFHMAFPVRDLDSTRAFYVGVLGCSVGRVAPNEWIDFNFAGHQITAHLKPEECVTELHTNAVDGDAIPVRHFGLVMEWGEWEALAEQCRARGATFVLEPRVRFQGLPGEQGTFFLRDPSGNVLEFKTFRDISKSLFAPQ